MTSTEFIIRGTDKSSLHENFNFDQSINKCIVVDNQNYPIIQQPQEITNQQPQSWYHNYFLFGVCILVNSSLHPFSMINCFKQFSNQKQKISQQPSNSTLIDKSDIDVSEKVNIESHPKKTTQQVENLKSKNSTDIHFKDEIKTLNIPKVSPKTISKHDKFLRGGSLTNVFSTSKLLTDNFFGPNAKIISKNIKKRAVVVRPKIEVPINTFITIDSINNCNINCCLIIEELYSTFDKEEQYIARTNIVNNHIYINNDMIEVLIGWLIKVNVEFRCSNETIFLTVHLIKEYIHRVKNLKRSKFQLFGAVCFLIASKYEDIIIPKVCNIIVITDRAYSRKEIIDAEIEILTVLNFNLTIPTIYTFLCRYLKAAHADIKMVDLACYISELTLNECQYYSYLPSEIAAGAIYLTRKFSNRNNWSSCLTYHTKYSEEHVSKIANKMEISCMNAYKNKDNINYSEKNAAFMKYSNSKYNRVSLMFKN